MKPYNTVSWWCCHDDDDDDDDDYTREGGTTVYITLLDCSSRLNARHGLQLVRSFLKDNGNASVPQTSLSS
jgi:hypothetical protein